MNKKHDKTDRKRHLKNLQSRSTILESLDSIHRSLLLNNIKYEDKVHSISSSTSSSSSSSSSSATPLPSSISSASTSLLENMENRNKKSNAGNLKKKSRCSENKMKKDKWFNNTNINNKNNSNNKRKITLDQKNRHNEILNEDQQNSCIRAAGDGDDTDLSDTVPDNHVSYQLMENQNINNSNCEKLNRECTNGFCYCFTSSNSSSTADDNHSDNKDQMVSTYIKNKPKNHQITINNQNDTMTRINIKINTFKHKHPPNNNKNKQIEYQPSSPSTSSSICSSIVADQMQNQCRESYEFIDDNDITLKPNQSNKSKQSSTLTSPSSSPQPTPSSSTSSHIDEDCVFYDCNDFEQITVNSMKSDNTSSSIYEDAILIINRNETADDHKQQSVIQSFNNRTLCSNKPENLSKQKHLSQKQHHQHKKQQPKFTDKQIPKKAAKKKVFSTQQSKQPSPAQQQQQQQNFPINLTTSNNTNDNKPMIHIIQELTENRKVTSTVIINKEKIRQFKQLHNDTEEIPEFTQSRIVRNSKNNYEFKEKIINDNFCNEIFAQTVSNLEKYYEKNDKNKYTDKNYDNEDEECSSITSTTTTTTSNQTTSGGSSSVSVPFVSRPRSAEKRMGKLLKKRLRLLNEYNIKKQELYQQQHINNIPPVKPPRTFTHSSSPSTKQNSISAASSSPSSSIIISETTLPIDDKQHSGGGGGGGGSSVRKKKNQKGSGKNIGWNFTSIPNNSEGMDDIIQPSCPTLNEIITKPSQSIHYGWTDDAHLSNQQKQRHHHHHHEHNNKIGWYKPPDLENIIPSNILDMLTYDRQDELSKKILTSNLKAQPQHRSDYQLKEDIDTVDCAQESNSKTCPFNTSTPLRHKSFGDKSYEQKHLKTIKPRPKSLPTDSPSPAQLATTRSQPNICEKCHRKTVKTTNNHRKSLNSSCKAVVERTKNFFDSISLNRFKKSHQNNNATPTTSIPAAASTTIIQHSLSDSNLYHTPQKRIDLTAIQNEEYYLSGTDPEKRTLKTLNLTPKRIVLDGIDNTDSPKRINSTQNLPNAAPPEKPIRKSLLKNHQHQQHQSDSSNQSNENVDKNFDFDSPKKNKLIVGGSTNPDEVPNQSPVQSKRFTNFKLSPRILFKNFHSTKNSQNDKTYKSFTDNNNETIALMGEYLHDISELMMIEEPPFSSAHDQNDSKIRKDFQNTKDKVLTKNQRIADEPIYSEIPCADRPITTNRQSLDNTSAKPNITEIYLDHPSSSKYLMINNNPNLLYATVNKQSKRNSVPDDMQSTDESDSDSTNNSSLHLNIVNDFAQSLQNIIDNNYTKYSGGDHIEDQDNADIITKIRKIDEMHLTKSAVNFRSSTETFTSDCMSGDTVNSDIVNMINRLEKLKAPFEYDYFTKAIPDDDILTNDLLLTSLSTSSSSTSLGGYSSVSRYQPEHQVQLHRDMSTISEASLSPSENPHTYQYNNNTTSESVIYDRDIGYDTVDFQTTLTDPNQFNQTDDNQESDIKSSITPIKSSPSVLKTSSPASSSLSPTTKNLKKLLRDSFRKSKSYLKYERKRLSELFTDMNKSNSQQTRSDDNQFITSENEMTEQNQQIQSSDRISYANGKRAEILYQKINEKLNDNNSESQELIKNFNKYFIKLIRQITYQRNLRSQLKEAVRICRNAREFKSSTSELVEAERLLIVSNIKEIAAKNELIKFDNRMYNIYYSETDVQTAKGTIYINQIEISLKREALYDTHFNYFYICVGIYKDQVRSTMTKERGAYNRNDDDDIRDDKIIFDCDMNFIDLDATFEIRLEIYVLRLRKNARTSAGGYLEQKTLVQMDSILRKSVDVNNLTKLTESTSAGIITSPKTDDIDLDMSRFKMHGHSIVTSFTLSSYQFRQQNTDLSPYIPSSSSLSEGRHLNQIDSNQYQYSIDLLKAFNFTLSGLNNNLIGPLIVQLNCNIMFDDRNTEGFLTISNNNDNHKNWNRRWCRINGLTMNFWNYPQDTMTMPPVLMLDLTKCICDRINLVDRKLCAKTKTFSIEIFNGLSYSYGGGAVIGGCNNGGGDDGGFVDNSNGNRIKNYFMSADDQQELNKWLDELNRILKFIHDWRI